MSKSSPVKRRVLVDTGPLVAILDSNDFRHAECVATLATLRPPLLTCLPVLTEAAYLLEREGVAATRLLERLGPSGPLDLLPLDATDLLGGVRDYLNRYRSLGLQLADACLAHLGDREGIDTVFTLDRRDFGAVVLRSGAAFQILP